MPSIDFHTGVPEKLRMAWHLARKAHAAGMRVVLRAERADLETLDAALWESPPDAFMPHVMAGDALAAHTPVILSTDDAAPLPHYQVLINLGRNFPAHYARFERIIEIVAADSADAEAGRQRYSRYRDLGCPPTHYPYRHKPA